METDKKDRHNVCDDECKEVAEIVDECKDIIKNSQELLDELKEMREGIDFLVNEYMTNKRYFCSEGNSPRVEDVIKTTFEFAWAQAKLYTLK